jgi:tRNA(fMet)-specific endonuclease VapC
MIILNTDCLSLLDRQTGTSYLRLQAKLDEFPSDEIVTTIITFEEQMRGWMAFLAKMRSIDEQVFAYQTLKQYFD